ncbi:uncharacterized protein LOC134746452 isoform X2 [Cydia strobilella]|uniref:uncharacterized protein LOC134746452 isoform X2 n=1 Tax=Cydia strobilella TaxID=1100964 RepID=UPI003004A74A
MEIGEKIFAGMEEPQWLEQKVMGELKLWHIMFICLGVVTVMIVMVCCCFRFRIPRTKQQIEADYQRRKITAKFRHQLETIHDNKMDAMSLTDGIFLLLRWSCFTRRRRNLNLWITTGHSRARSFRRSKVRWTRRSPRGSRRSPSRRWRGSAS